MYVSQFLICIAQWCAVMEYEHYVMYKDLQSCEAAAAVNVQKLLALLKDKPVEAVGFRCIDKTDSSV